MILREMHPTRTLLALIICALPLAAHASEFGDILTSAEAVNETYRAMVIDAELAELRYEKNRIEARERIEELTAEADYLAARIEGQRSLQAFYTEVVDAVYGAVAADYERRIADWNDRLAQEQESVVEDEFQNGLVPESVLFDARIAVRSAAVERTERSWYWNDALESLNKATGISYDQVALPVSPSLSIRLTLEQWTHLDLSVERTRIAQEIARLRADRLASNAAGFDTTTLAIELQRAEFATKRAISATERAYESLHRRLTTLPEIVLIRREQLILSEASQVEAQERFARGLVSAAQRDQTLVRILTARLNLANAERDYVRAISEYAAATGVPLGDLL